MMRYRYLGAKEIKLYLNYVRPRQKGKIQYCCTYRCYLHTYWNFFFGCVFVYLTCQCQRCCSWKCTEKCCWTISFREVTESRSEKRDQ